PDDELAAAVTGHDLGVKLTVATSDGRTLAVAAEKQARMAKARRRIQRLQRKQARQMDGSGRQRKTKRAVARTHARLAHLRRDHVHQVSHRLVRDAGPVIAFEGLRLRNMVRRPKPVLKESGEGYAPNGARRKAGLNRALHGAGLGMLRDLATYKAARVG